MVDYLLLAAVVFGRTMIGLVVRPYETYRRIVDRGKLGELVYIALLVAAYFLLASLVKVAAFRPFLLTRQFLVLGSAAILTYAIVVLMVWVVGRRVGGCGTLRSLSLAWGYTLLPTVAWFLATSILSLVLPPPRTESVAGIAFSIVFLVFSITLFFWKLTLGYLTLRFGLRLDLARILAVSAVVSPAIAVWSFGMYRLGIFKVPFV